MLTSEARLLSTARPFWHRPEPLTSVIQLDPGHARLRQLFPTSWQHLLKVKVLLDCTAHLDVPSALDNKEHQTWVRRLLGETVHALDAFAAAERARGDESASGQAEALSATIDVYARTGVWPTFTVHAPSPDQPWIYCGPLSTWAERDTRMPLTLLVTTPEPGFQQVIDHITAALPAVRDITSHTLGRPAVPATPTPGMHTTSLVLAGGESALGHKNFAHFMPLETPGGVVVESPFTVIFTNVHRERLVRCSLPLLGAYLGEEPTWAAPDDVVAASLAWFRCHDLGHFWRAEHYTEKGSLAGTLDDFDLMALEETYADSLGVLCASQLWDVDHLSVAFFAELPRYLSRNTTAFGDSVAAMLELGRLAEHGVEVTTPTARLAKQAADVLAELVPVLHDGLWTDEPADVDALRATIDRGRVEAQRFAPLYGRIPTDVNYTFG